MPTILDVAKKAGLSRSTVSRVINDHPSVSEDTRKLVQEVMYELGYTPNSSARQLRTKKTQTISVIVPRITNPFYSQVLDSIVENAEEEKYQVLMCQTKQEKEKELKYLDFLRTKQVDGVILLDVQNEWEVIKKYLDYGPIVMCNEYLEGAHIPIIKLDQVYGAYIGTNHLLQQGHKKLAFCHGRHISQLTADRFKGFKKALSEHQLVFNEEYLFNDVYSIQDGKTIFHQIKEMDNPPTAIFTGSDEIAAGIVSEADIYNWDVPGKLAVLGFDNQVISTISRPQISTINQPISEIGKLAAEVLIKKMNEDNSKRIPIREIYELPISLIVRESTVKK